MLKVDSLSKSFKTNVVLDSVTIDFDRGKIILLVGENGSGKTTAFKILLGLIKPDGGTVDYDCSSYSGLIEEPAFNNSLTGQQNIDVLFENYDTDYFNNLLNDLNIYGIKIHMLNITKDTPIERMYKKGMFKLLSKEEYIDIRKLKDK